MFILLVSIKILNAKIEIIAITLKKPIYDSHEFFSSKYLSS
jgi:hypothetical protein